VASIFISHSSRDNAIAGEIKAWLKAQGYEQVFLDFDKETGLGAGKAWQRQLYEAMDRCHAVILIVTPAWLSSKWCFAEFTQAQALGKVVFPIIMTPDDLTAVGPEIREVQLELWNEAGQEHLRRRLKEVADEIARGHSWDATRPPWPGILSFEREDAAVFFGRDSEIRKVAELLETRRVHGGARFVLVLGASGSGKSSLMKAGVLPFLARDRRRWVVMPPVRPGTAPVTGLAKALAEAVGRERNWQTIRNDLTGAHARAALVELIEELRVGQAREAMALLPIDQLEEAFVSSVEPERAAYLKLLSLIADREQSLPLIAVATVRSDLLGDILNSDDFASAHEAWTLGSLPREQLPSVIEGPARVASIRLEPGLVERILRDVGSADALPLLAFALRELNDRFGSGKRLSIVEYEALGDPASGLSPLEYAVRRKAEETFGSAQPSPQELEALKETFVGALVTVNEEGIRLRRPARIADIPSEGRRLVDRMVAARLLTFRTEADEDLVEVAHEALFKAWPQLSSWLDQEQDFLIGRRQIEEAQRLWQSTPDNVKDKALLSGILLEKAREWIVAYPVRLRATRDFILASIRKDDADRTRARRRQRMLTYGSIAAAGVFALLENGGCLRIWPWIADLEGPADRSRAGPVRS
jgi:hypothetical protein